MKHNQRTVKIYASTHALAYRLSCRHGVSMVGLLELALHRLAADGPGEFPQVDPRCRKVNARRILGVGRA